MANTVSEKTLQEKIDAKAAAKTVWQSDQKEWEYVAIPAENALGEKHDTMGINTHYFEAGHTYLVPPEIAATLKERLAVYARACVRVLQPRRDYAAEKAVERFGTKGGTPIDPSVLTAE